MKRLRLACVSALALVPATGATASEYKESLTLQGITFELSATENAGASTLTIKPSGLKAMNDPVVQDVPGRVLRAEIADIDSNGDPEIYVFTVDEKAKRGGVVGYAVNKKKSMSPIFVPDFTEDPKLSAGYAGGDESAVVETFLVTRFKIYEGSGASAKPTDKWRQLQYKLKPGEAGWKLVLSKITEY